MAEGLAVKRESLVMASLDQLLLDSDTHDQFLQKLMASLVASTRTSQSIPKGLDYSYHNSFSEFRHARDSASQSTADLLQTLLNHCRISDDANILSDDAEDPYFYSQMAETIDALLDHAEVMLSSTSDSVSSADPLSLSMKQSLFMDKDRIIRENIRNIPKPQMSFLFDIDNSRETPFIPKLKVKFHSKIEYVAAPSKRSVDDDDKSALEEFYPHPYEHELVTLDYPASQLKAPTEEMLIMPSPSTLFHYIETEDQLVDMIKDFRNTKEIAVDLEHHSVRSFQGLTCLMQVRALLF